MRSSWDTENSMQTPAFPRVGLLSLPQQPMGEKGQGVATIALPYGVLLVMADGPARETDDPGAPERQAIQAVKRIMQNARLNPEDVRAVSDLMRQALHAANGDLYQRHTQEGKGRVSVSCSLVLVTRGRAYVAHVGNARIYLVRNNAANRLTRDHTTAQTWIDHGIMTEEQARERPEAHSLSRALGEKSRIEPEVRSLPVRMEKGDVLLLCTATVHRYLDDDEMGSMVARLEPEHACQELCEVASSRSKSSACKTLVYQSGPQRQGNYPRLLQQRRLRKQRKIVGIIGGAVLLFAAVAAIWSIFGPAEKNVTEKKAPAVAMDLQLVENDVSTSADEGLLDAVAAPDLPPSTASDVSVAEVAADRVGQAGGVDLIPAIPDAVATPDVVEQEEVVDSEVAAVAQADAVTDVSASADVLPIVPPVPDVVAAQPEPASPTTPPQPGAETAEPTWAPPISDAARKLCEPSGLERGDARRVKDLRQLVNRGLGFLNGEKKNASAAARQAKAARKTLDNSSDLVKQRCADHVQDLLNHTKARYLHLSWVSASRAMNNLANRAQHCDKSFRMARDAQRLGATDEEIKEARRICSRQ